MGSELVRAAYAAFFFDDEKAALVDDPRVRRGANANERMVLVVDAVIRGLGVKDSRDVAKELADAADDL